MLFLQLNQKILGFEQVLWMTMVLPTFPQRKVGRAEG
jgi:hypothetical protein